MLKIIIGGHQVTVCKYKFVEHSYSTLVRPSVLLNVERGLVKVKATDGFLKNILHINFIQFSIQVKGRGSNNITRMTTSISSKAFCSITDRQADKIFTE